MGNRLSIIFALAIAGCQSAPASDLGCETGTCDQDRDDLGNLCEERRADVFNPNHETFTNTSIRWSCKDVANIPEDLQGQEYCESFAIVQLPSSGETIALGQQPSEDAPAEWSNRYVELSDDDYILLDELAYDDPTAQAGACVFSSWQSDIVEPLPVCTESECADYLGMPLTGENFRMRHEVNSLLAAENLVYDCLQTFAGITGFDGNPVTDHFTRGCMLNELINRTSYRKSDTAICTAAMRLTECNCYPKGTDRDFPDVLGSLDLRGFHLGTWDNRKAPPPGCHYIETGDVVPKGVPEVENLIACPLTADEVLSHASASGGQVDLKTYCDQKYADDVVVHVLINPLEVECTPEDSPSPYADSCPSRAQWVMEP
jgi:hypothetical protein